MAQDKESQYIFIGTVSKILDLQTFASGFTKRSLIVKQTKEFGKKSYDNIVKFDFKKDNVELLDGIHVGQQVKILFAVDGRQWDGPKGTSYFVDLTGLKLDVLGGEQASNVPPPAEPTEQNDADMMAELDSMPF